MARIFRRQRTLHPVAELNVTNMVDLGFTLLLIFMMTASITREEQTIPLNLPGESKKPQQQLETDFQAISVDQNANIYVGSKKVNFTELGKALDEFAARPKPPVIRLRGDMNINYGQIIKVMDELMKRNLTKISLDTETAK